MLSFLLVAPCATREIATCCGDVRSNAEISITMLYSHVSPKPWCTHCDACLAAHITTDALMHRVECMLYHVEIHGGDFAWQPTVWLECAWHSTVLGFWWYVGSLRSSWTWVWLYTHIYLSLSLSLSLSLYIYIYMYIYLCIYKYMHTILVCAWEWVELVRCTSLPHSIT